MGSKMRNITFQLISQQFCKTGFTFLMSVLWISQFHLRPAPPRADPRALAFFMPWMANSRGWGLLSCQTLPGWGRKKRANAPSYVNTATFFIARTVK